MKYIQLVSVSEIESYPELWAWLDLEDDELFNEDYLSFFEGDPDIVKVNGETSFFSMHDVDQTRYVICSGEDADTWDFLTSFAGADFQDVFYDPNENNWETFDNASTAIAYRGGRGYVYTIWLPRTLTYSIITKAMQYKVRNEKRKNEGYNVYVDCVSRLTGAYRGTNMFAMDVDEPYTDLSLDDVVGLNYEKELINQ